jgi:hypothetical protein
VSISARPAFLGASEGAPFPTPPPKRDEAHFQGHPNKSSDSSDATRPTNVRTADLEIASTAVSTHDNLDFTKLLTEFYQEHNPSKLGEVPATIEKYKGREMDMFDKLAKK